MQYDTKGTIEARFVNGKVLVNVQGNELDLMAVPDMDDMRVVLTALSVDAVTKAMSSGIQPAPDPVEQTVQSGPDLTGYADSIREQFQAQADKAQERLNELTSLNDAAIQAAQGQ